MSDSLLHLTFDEPTAGAVGDLLDALEIQCCDVTAQDIHDLLVGRPADEDLAFELRGVAASVRSMGITPGEIAQAVDVLADVLVEQGDEAEAVRRLASLTAAISSYRPAVAA